VNEENNEGVQENLVEELGKETKSDKLFNNVLSY
jgi:hypothetical protein